MMFFDLLFWVSGIVEQDLLSIALTWIKVSEFVESAKICLFLCFRQDEWKILMDVMLFGSIAYELDASSAFVDQLSVSEVLLVGSLTIFFF